MRRLHHRRSRADHLVALVWLFTLGACADSEPVDVPLFDADHAPITILGATLIDGTGRAPREDTVIVVQGERITSIGLRADTPVPKGGSIVDGTGRFVIPGLIDLHCHYGAGRDRVVRALRTQIRFGVTTARSMGSDGPDNLAVFSGLDADDTGDAWPRLYTAGRGLSHPDGNPPGADAPLTPGDAREHVRRLAGHSVDVIKVWVDSWHGTVPKMDREIQAAIVDEAAAHAIPVVAHVFDEADVRYLAGLGVSQFLHAIRDRDVDPELVRLATQHELSFAPALSKGQDLWYLAEQPSELDGRELRDAFTPGRLNRLLSLETRTEMLADPRIEMLKTAYERSRRFVRTMHEAGVTIAVGSDSGAGNVAFGWGTHHELRLLVDAGLSSLDALTAATGVAARLLDGDAAEFGTLAPGQIADLVLLTADPIADIANTRRIERVMRAGVWTDRR